MNTLIKTITVTTSLVLAQHATALSFECQLDNLSRTITVTYPEQTPVPCSVQYTKAGNTQTLWQANNAEGYCEKQAREFVAKHENWGWQCTNLLINSAATSESSAPNPAQ